MLIQVSLVLKHRQFLKCVHLLGIVYDCPRSLIFVSVQVEKEVCRVLAFSRGHYDGPSGTERPPE
jgi:hypothetical protein